jgi:hypothetical protein
MSARPISNGRLARRSCYELFARPPGSAPKIVVPPFPKRGVTHGGTERERHAAQIDAPGPNDVAEGPWLRTPLARRDGDLAAEGPGGDRLTARSLAAQRKELALRISTANKAIRHAKPVTVRIA